MFDTEVILPMPDTKKFPQPATAPDGLANALPDVPVCDPDCHGEPDIVARLRSDLPDDEVLYDLSELFRVFGAIRRVLLGLGLGVRRIRRAIIGGIQRIGPGRLRARITLRRVDYIIVVCEQ